MKLFVTLFQEERPLTLFLHERLKELIISLMDRFVCSAVFESVSSAKCLMMVDLGFGTNKALKKLKTVQSPEVRNFRKEVRSFMVKLIEKLREQFPLKYFLPFHLGSLSPSIFSTPKIELLVNRLKKL